MTRATLRFVCEQAGADKVLMGTDLPFTIAEMEPVQFVDACEVRRRGARRDPGRHRREAVRHRR